MWCQKDIFFLRKIQTALKKPLSMGGHDCCQSISISASVSVPLVDQNPDDATARYTVWPWIDGSAKLVLTIVWRAHKPWKISHCAERRDDLYVVYCAVVRVAGRIEENEKDDQLFNKTHLHHRRSCRYRNSRRRSLVGLSTLFKKRTPTDGNRFSHQLRRYIFFRRRFYAGSIMQKLLNWFS